jgi:hypothetical protein
LFASYLQMAWATALVLPKTKQLWIALDFMAHISPDDNGSRLPPKRLRRCRIAKGSARRGLEEALAWFVLLIADKKTAKEWA